MSFLSLMLLFRADAWWSNSRIRQYTDPPANSADAPDALFLTARKRASGLEPGLHF
jgi:hypothetical protein